MAPKLLKLLPALVAASASVLPIMAAQAAWARARVPAIRDAQGPRSGTILGGDRTLSLIVIGESTVAGVGAPTHARALTGQIAASLSRRTARTVSWAAVGKRGVTAERALGELVGSVPETPCDVVVIAIGVNDVLALTPPERFKEDLRRMVEAIRYRVGDALVVIAGVPPIDRFPALPSPLRDALAIHARRLDEAASTLVPEIPVAVHVPTRIDGASELFCDDGFHPSPAGYEAWGDEIAASVPLPSSTDEPPSMRS